MVQKNLKLIKTILMIMGFIPFHFSVNSAFGQNSCVSHLGPETSLEQKVQSYLPDIKALDLNYPKDVISALDSLYEKIKAEPNDLNLLKTYWDVARYLERRNVRLANQQLEVAKQITRLENNSESSVYNLVLALIEVKNFSEALRHINSLQQLSPKKLKYIMLEARLLYRLGSYKLVLTTLDQIDFKDAQDFNVLELKAKTYLKIGSDLRRTSENIDSIQFYLSQSEFYYKELIRQGDNIKPSHYYNLAHALVRQNSFSKNKEVLDLLEFALIDLSSDLKFELTFRVLLQMNEFNEAKLLIDNALFTKPDSAHLKRLKRLYVQKKSNSYRQKNNPDYKFLDEEDWDLPSYEGNFD